MVPRSFCGNRDLEKPHQRAGVSSGWPGPRLCLAFLLCRCWDSQAVPSGWPFCELCGVLGVGLDSGLFSALTQSLLADFPCAGQGFSVHQTCLVMHCQAALPESGLLEQKCASGQQWHV